MKIKIILMFGIVLSMFFIYDVNVNAIEEYQTNLIGVEISYSGSNGNEAFYQRTNYGLENGYIYFGYPNRQNMGEQTPILPDGDYTIYSTNEKLRYMYLGVYLLDIYTYTYEFEVLRQSSGDIQLNVITTTDPQWVNDRVIDDLEADYATWRLKDDRIDEESVQSAYESGYDDAKNDYGYLMNGVYETASSWGQSRYNDGLAQGDANALSLQNMIPGVLGVFIAFFFQMASISVLGVSVLDLLALMFGVGVALLIFKVLVK